MPALLMLTGPLAGRRIPVQGAMTLGRSPSCEIPLDDTRVSRRHARMVLENDHVRLEDLGSRNGTLVNGRRVESSVTLESGDYVQVGETTILFDPPTRAQLTDRIAEGISQVSVEEALPVVGSEAAVLSLASALLSAGSEAAVLRRTTEELARALGADKAACVLGEAHGLITAAVVGAQTVDVPRQLAEAALTSKQVSVGTRELCAPMVPGGSPALGLLYIERDETFTPAERDLAAALGRVAGEGLAAVRVRQGPGVPDEALVGASKTFKAAVEDARRAAVVSTGVCLRGERGSGRGALSRLIHALSPRSLSGLVEVDCRREAAIVQSELFGRSKARQGRAITSALLRADGGTLLLRHIDAMPKALGDQLARFLERRVAPGPRGGELAVDVRLIATSGEPLAAIVQRGDLDSALSESFATEIFVPPLRDRGSDVSMLFEHFLSLATTAVQMPMPTVLPEATKLLLDYTWPGNVLELELVARRIALLYPGMDISALRLPLELQRGTSAKPRSLEQLLSAVEREAISDALREAKGKKIRAAEILGISRPTLDKKIDEYRLSIDKARTRTAPG